LCTNPYARLQNNSSWTGFYDLLGMLEGTFQKSHTDPSASHLESCVI
jgi:hypothetical protein